MITYIFTNLLFHFGPNQMEKSSDHQEILGKMEKENHFDVLIIGAGISGIDAAYHIQKHCDWVRNKRHLYFHFQILHKKQALFSTNLV